MRQAWQRGQRLRIHGWVFDIASGHIHPQTRMIGDEEALQSVCRFHNGVVGH